MDRDFTDHFIKKYSYSKVFCQIIDLTEITFTKIDNSEV